MKALLTGGGTGGHILPLFNIGRQLKKQGVRLLYVGSKTGLEYRIALDMETVFLPITGWVRKGIFDRIRFFPNLFLSLMVSLNVLRRFKPDVVISTGGFVSVPVLMLSVLFGIPIILVEINAIPGLSTRLFSYFAKRVFLGFYGGKKYLPHTGRIVVSGIPVKEEIFKADKKEAMEFFGFKKKKKTLLIFGGSRGARFLVELAFSLYDILEKDWNFILLGMDDCNGFERMECFRFLQKMEYAYAISDVVISRAGGMTIGELLATGIPAIIIPYPYAYLDHQFYNGIQAKALRKNVALVRENETEPEKIAHLIKSLYGRREKGLEQNPSQRIAEEIIDYVWRN